MLAASSALVREGNGDGIVSYSDEKPETLRNTTAFNVSDKLISLYPRKLMSNSVASLRPSPAKSFATLRRRVEFSQLIGLDVDKRGNGICLIPSMGGVADAQANAMFESFFERLQCEMIFQCKRSLY